MAVCANKVLIPRLVRLPCNLPFIQVSVSAPSRQLLELRKSLLSGKNWVESGHCPRFALASCRTETRRKLGL
jgi:hypothetical protein